MTKKPTTTLQTCFGTVFSTEVRQYIIDFKRNQLIKCRRHRANNRYSFYVITQHMSKDMTKKPDVTVKNVFLNCFLKSTTPISNR